MTWHHIWETAELGAAPRGVSGTEGNTDPAREVDQDRAGSVPTIPRREVVITALIVAGLLLAMGLALVAMFSRNWA